MRSWGRLFVVLCLIASFPLPASGQIAGAGAGGGQFAEADWLYLKKDSGTFYFAFAIHNLEAAVFPGEPPFAGAGSFAVVGKGDCHVERGKHFVVVSCSGRGIAREVTLQQFQVDPLLSSATLRFKARKFVHRVRWRGKGQFTPASGAGHEGAFVGAGTGAWRDARASGRLFGKRVAGGGLFTFAYLTEGLGAGAGVETGGVEVAPDGTVTVERTFRIRR